MKKRFNIVVINSDRIDGFLNNFEKKIINFDRKVDFITLLDASKKKRLLEGLDNIGMSLEKTSSIDDYEEKIKRTRTWILQK